MFSTSLLYCLFCLQEVSSSQDKVDRKPTIGDLEKAKQSISAYQEEVKQKEKTIQQLELQKKKVEEKSQAMLRMAESLKLSTEEGTVSKFVFIDTCLNFLSNDKNSFWSNLKAFVDDKINVI